MECVVLERNTLIINRAASETHLSTDQVKVSMNTSKYCKRTQGRVQDLQKGGAEEIARKARAQKI
jgi:hypothetical protein